MSVKAAAHDRAKYLLMIVKSPLTITEMRSNMRTYPIDGDFDEGYERAFNDIMYHLMANASPKTTAVEA
jgi:hypothetical protein